jgi:hypothetical protein
MRVMELPPTRRPLTVGVVLLVKFTMVATVVSCAPAARCQTVKASVVSTTVEGTTLKQWLKDLGYNGEQVYPLNLTALGCPLIEVDVSGTKLPLMLDSGTAHGFAITNYAPPVPHHVGTRTEELNADGSHRGESFQIAVESMSVLGKVFDNVSGRLSDWRMFSSEPFNGTVGLDFFLDRRFTLDYKSGKVGVNTLPLPEKLDHKRYAYLDLIGVPKSQGNILYARGSLGGRDVLVYFDTGYNVSFIDPQFAGDSARVARPGMKFSVFREGVPLQLGGHTFVLNELREDAIKRGAGFELPVALVLGNDVLSQFILTVDVRAKKLVIAMEK